MNNSLKCGMILWWTAMFLVLSGPASARATPPTQSAPQLDQQDAMIIQSNTLEADDKNGIVTFAGDVEAKREDFTVYCRKMVVYYVKLPSREESESVAGRVDRIVATGNVKIVRADGGVATGEKAVYYQEDEKLVLTGAPVVRQKDNSVEGDRITLYLRENRSVVESSSDKKVKAVIFPAKDEGQGL
ncbi:MAG: lipopolysaccharide transport periplasmic protein LptA [Deltaproteobacteria bacterium]|nr:lipopolysaccharide transport periplasmic protein LptA [Deltaproteobacteria bacterium]